MRASETAYQLLRDEIIQWKLEPGTPLGEVETSQRLGVSRTPLREALSRLVAEGLVRTGPGRTAVVTSLSRDDIVELFELREALETQSARLHSDVPHSRFHRVAGNGHMIQQTATDQVMSAIRQVAAVATEISNAAE